MQDINWELSFAELRERDTTKHIHRLHPYKGKFIPQLVEYFLDRHTDGIKTDACFSSGDIILDPFCGSGTTLIQANELGMHGIGVDVSLFNAMISNLKLAPVPLDALVLAMEEVSQAIASNTAGESARKFEDDLLANINLFNSESGPAELNPAKAFLPVFYGLLERHQVSNRLVQDSALFQDSWYMPSVRGEIADAIAVIFSLPDTALRDVLVMVLSRTVRSVRATRHSEVASLKHPVAEPYYCRKHRKVCKPLFSMLRMWERYAKDTLKRKKEFDGLRTDSYQICLTGDARSIDIFSELDKVNGQFGTLATRRKISGIFSSPPYIGMINYHEQHAYAYELFGFPRNDQLEIGAKHLGKGKEARKGYVNGIASAISNCLQYMTDDCDVFLVANDQFGLYPDIAEQSRLVIYREYKRPVLNRAEGGKALYSETIFHLKRRS